MPDQAQDDSNQSCTAGTAGRSADGEQGQDLQKLLKLYKEEREQLSKDVLYYKQSCKDLKRRLKAEVCFSSFTSFAFDLPLVVILLFALTLQFVST